mgnify:CR=1 FL=1
MKKKILVAFAIIASVTASAFVAPEHYCKNNPNSNTGICSVSNTTGVADCLTLVNSSTIKDCYGAVNEN